MSKHHLRKDPVCQNCGHHVEERFCGHCGQENTETRQSFGHLLRHFVEDLTHYDGAFWRTMKNLLFKPAYLTREFLKGRRASYVPPVRLYIFISFVTFLLPYLLPESEREHGHGSKTAHAADSLRVHEVRDSIAAARLVIDSSEGAPTFSIELSNRSINIPYRYKTLHELDSVQATLPESKRMSGLEYWANSRMVTLQERSQEELSERFFESVGHSFPKTLFIYLPLFAFVLWLFHNKKRWLYFDHAIFTLHYFSFLLLLCNILTLSDLFFFIDHGLLLDIQMTAFFILSFAVFVYFAIAHRRMYGEGRLLSLFKSVVIYTINMLIFIFILFGLMLYSLLSIH